MKQSTRISFILFLTVFMDMMGFSIIFPLFPKILEHYIKLGHDPILNLILTLVNFIGEGKDSQYFIILFGGIIGGIYSILQFIFAPIWGKLSDRLGRKPILIFTSLGNLLGYIVWLFSNSFTLFVVSRVITGGMGGNISVASASMADNTSDKDRAKGMGTIGAAIGLGFIFGPPISGILSGVEISSIFTIFSGSTMVAVVLAAINLILVSLALPETNINKTSIRSSVHPVFQVSKTSVKEIPKLALLYLLFGLSFSGFEFCINFYLDHVFHFTPQEIGYTFVYIGLVIILIQGGAIRRLSGKMSERNITLMGALSLLIGFLIISSYDSVYITFFALFFIASGSAFMNPGISSMASLFSPKDEQGRNLGIIRGYGALARTISPFAFSFIYFKYTHSVTFIVSAVVILFAIFLVRTIKEKKLS